VNRILARATVSLLLAAAGVAQGPAGPAPNAPKPAGEPWEYSFVFDTYIVPNDVDYGNPVFTADHKWLHLEARYNYEELHTGSLWAGYNFSWGKNLVLDVTPILGAVFGRINGLAPGCEASLTYKRFEASISNEFVITPANTGNSFYYAWPQLTYSVTNWLKVGAVAQHTKAYQTPLDLQRGFLVGFSHKKWEATTYILNPELTPTVVLEFGISF
jgi:hypothetical protein